LLYKNVKRSKVWGSESLGFKKKRINTVIHQSYMKLKTIILLIFFFFLKFLFIKESQKGFQGSRFLQTS